MHEDLMNLENLIILEDEKLPVDHYKNKGFFKKKVQFKDGGFVDSIFLGSIIATSGLWFILYILFRK